MKEESSIVYVCSKSFVIFGDFFNNLRSSSGRDKLANLIGILCRGETAGYQISDFRTIRILLKTVENIGPLNQWSST